MTGSSTHPAPVGSRLRRWAEAHCARETLDTLILPIVADLQYEEAVAKANTFARWWFRARNYLGLAKALGIQYATAGRWRMAGFDRSPRLGAGDFARIGLAVPAVAVALASVAYLCQAGLADILYLNGARGDRVMWAWTLANSWPANVVSGALLAAILVAGFLWAIPPAHRSYLLSAGQPSLGRVGLYAVVVLCGALGVAWGGNWTHGADRSWLPFNFWPLVMGLSVLAGALAPFWLARRADWARPATDGPTCSGRRTTASLDMIRIGLMMPCALVAAAAVEVLVVKYARIALDLSGNRDWERALYASAFWLASPLMAAAFVATLRACAPPTRRAAVALGAGGVVVLWGALLVAGSAYPWTRRPDLNGWALAMGPATWLCGAATLWLLGRRVRRGVEARTTTS